MFNTRLLATCTAALLCAACATAPPPKPVASLPRSTDAADLNKALADSYASLVARETKPVDAIPPADIDAGISMDIPNEAAVQSAVRLFSNELRNDIQTYLTKSAKYKGMIEKVFAENHLPKGLAYLPVIESGYSTTMTSRSGARGVWQFMSETAREYGLRVDWWVDERCDPERSTRAAAQYLQDLYREFNDWPLVLAAYNAGPGRIRRTITNSGATSFWQIADIVPKETKGYVPTFYATLVIASDPSSYGFRLGTEDGIDAKRIELDGPVSLKYVASVANVNEDVIRDLNPMYRRGVLPPGRSTIRVPVKAVDAVVARASTLKNEDPDLAVCTYTLRDGDSIKHLARSLGVPTDTILAMNDIRGAREGDTIYLPVRARDLSTALNAEGVYYAVNKGDTLYSIARAHNLSVEELRDLNDLESNSKLHKGQRLRVNAPRTLTAGQ